MTIHVHTDISEVAIGEHRHRRDKKKAGRKPEADTSRTWAFDCVPECEQRVLTDVAFTANHPGAVALSRSEEQEAARVEKETVNEQRRIAQAQMEMAREYIATRDAG